MSNRFGHLRSEPPVPERSQPKGRGRPGIYYGWILAVALGITQLVSWGILYYAISVFLAPMEREMGWTRAESSGAFSLGLLVSGVAAIPIGRYLDRHGARLVMTLGSAAGVLLLLAWSAVQDLVSFYLVWAGIGLVLAAMSAVGAAALFRMREPVRSQ